MSTVKRKHGYLKVKAKLRKHFQDLIVNHSHIIQSLIKDDNLWLRDPVKVVIDPDFTSRFLTEKLTNRNMVEVIILYQKATKETKNGKI